MQKTNKYTIVALIPARYASTRFPAKLLKKLHGKSILQRTYERVIASELFDDVIVVCDDDRLEQEITQIGGKVYRSTKEYESGSDRIAEVAQQLDADIIVNIQGDEPFIEKEAMQKVTLLFSNPQVEVASLVIPISDKEKIQNPNCVKVVLDAEQRALYFSRAPIPFNRDQSEHSVAYQHVGIYAYRKEALLKFTSLPVSYLEKVEKLENLRMLENGMAIYMDIVTHVGISIDTEEDFRAAEAFLNQDAKATRPKYNKTIAGYHMLMILSAVDYTFHIEEEKIIREYLFQEFPFYVSLDNEMETIASLSHESWELHFIQCRDDFYEDSTHAERMNLLKFALHLSKADQVISPEENHYLQLLFEAWDSERE
ncbi:MAG: 3-deoxy-manno-octulosonate cytidylyltransferase [Chitinophagaceae bacterium]